jgi:hypothetical protein
MKLDPIRAKDRALCDRAVMEKWLYGVEQRSVQRATNTSSPINHCEDQTTTTGASGCCIACSHVVLFQSALWKRITPRDKMSWM